MRAKRASRREKRRRAWRAYLDLVDAADSIQERLAQVLDTFGLTMEEFRLLLLLYLEGPLTGRRVTEMRQRNAQNMYRTIRRAEELGWVQWRVKRVTPELARTMRLAKDRRGRDNHGSHVGVVSLTAQGERLIERMAPAQESAAGALMRTLDGREQITLSQLCRKLCGDELLRKMLLGAALIRAHEEFDGSEDGEAESKPHLDM